MTVPVVLSQLMESPHIILFGVLVLILLSAFLWESRLDRKKLKSAHPSLDRLVAHSIGSCSHKDSTGRDCS